MLRARRMQTEQLIGVRPKIVPVRTTLENIFERLSRDFELTIRDLDIQETGRIQMREAVAPHFKLDYTKSRLYTCEARFEEREGINYLTEGAATHAFSDEDKFSLIYQVPSNKVRKSKLALIALSERKDDIAMRLAKGVWVLDPSNGGKTAYKFVNENTSNEVYRFLKKCINYISADSV